MKVKFNLVLPLETHITRNFGLRIFLLGKIGFIDSGIRTVIIKDIEFLNY